MIDLTPKQRQELQAPEPLVRDPQTNKTYVLVPREVYARLKGLLTMNDYDPDEGMALMNEVMAEDDRNDPLLDSYQHHLKEDR